MYNETSDDIELYSDSSFIGTLSQSEHLNKTPDDTIELIVENNTIKIQFDIGNGINAEISVTKGYYLITIGVNLPSDFKGNIIGLLGNFDGDSSNEFRNRNGAMIPDNASEETIFNEFGQTWKILEDESLFSYKQRSDRNYKYYANVTMFFKPIFLDLFKNESSMLNLFSEDEPLMRTANDTCQSKPKQVYFQCMYDSAQTGDAKSGASTGEIFASAAVQKERQGILFEFYFIACRKFQIHTSK